MSNPARPSWTVYINVVSPESSRWIGTAHEFFDNETDAIKCAKRHTTNHCCAGWRPYFDSADSIHLGAVHKR